MHGNRDVGKDRRDPSGGNGDAGPAVDERVANVRQRVVDLLVNQLEVRQRRLVERTPVDDAVRTVDPALAVEMHEEAVDRADIGIVHREPLAPVVHRRADATELGHDRAAVLAQPVPDDFLETLTAELLSRLPLRGEVLLDRVLRRDARVVVAGQERGVEPAHAVPAHECVGERELEGVAHVQRARDVRGWVRDDERRPASLRLRVVQALVLPGALPALLDTLGPVQRFHLAGETSGRSRTPAFRARSPRRAAPRLRPGRPSRGPKTSRAPLRPRGLARAGLR